ncbi:MAG: class I mannose-6-phosphate isomerase [Bacteroidetes bacterium]|nr:class I mannose-6-phosphate isomerase [Bacteroidota bacterium]
MGFSYKPIRFDDFNALNTVNSVPEIAATYDEVANILAKKLPEGLVLLDGFPTANFSVFLQNLCEVSPNIITIDVSRFYRSSAEINELLKPYLPQDREIDPELIFGKLFDQDFQAFFDNEKVGSFLNSLVDGKTIILHGHGSACEIFRPFSKAVLYIDVTPKDTALRVYDGLYRCIGNPSEPDLDCIIRRTYFIDVELAVKLRKELVRNNQVDFYLLDSELSFSMLSKKAYHEVVDQLKNRPLRAKPVYVEGVWGGQFIKRYRQVPENLVDKVAWSFELIHTEASLLVNSGEYFLDLPFLTVMDAIGESLVGEKLYKQFDGNFPVRFNYDDTWHSNGNMSTQVHPNDEMAQKYYGDVAGQNEAYYVVLTGHGAKTLCGFKKDGREFLALCRQSEKDGSIVPYEEYIHAIPSDVGRQIFLPTGTIHASGRNQLVLELGTLTISAYTYKIYDYTRLDITGKQRPLHTNLAEQALVFDRDAEWVMKHIAFPPKLLMEGEGWREFLIGQYDQIYFETHRVEMGTGSRYPAENKDGFTVITIVDGETARIQSIDDPGHYYDASYLDVILVPASMRRYEVIATGKQPVVLHKTFVREDRYES